MRKHLEKYWLVCKLSFDDVLTYRFDFFVQVTKYAFAVILMAFVWQAAAKQTTIANFSSSDIVTYYFFAAIIYGLSNFHSFYLEDDIKLGSLSKHILKPIDPFCYYLSYQSAISLIDLLIKVLILPLLLIAFGFSLHVELINVLAFILYLPLIFFFWFCFITTVSSLSFWLKDVFSIRVSIMIFSRLLSGVFVPISLFPSWYFPVSRALPLQYLSFYPIQVLQNKLSMVEILDGLVILGAWCIAMFIINRWVWSRGMRIYEGTGI